MGDSLLNILMSTCDAWNDGNHFAFTGIDVSGLQLQRCNESGIHGCSRAAGPSWEPPSFRLLVMEDNKGSYILSILVGC